jgi:hypothetical protein
MHMGTACLISEELKFHNHKADDSANDKDAHGKMKQQAHSTFKTSQRENNDTTAGGLETIIECKDMNQMLFVSQISLDMDLLAADEDELQHDEVDEHGAALRSEDDEEEHFQQQYLHPYVDNNNNNNKEDFQQRQYLQPYVDDNKNNNTLDYSFSNIVNRHQQREHERYLRLEHHCYQRQEKVDNGYDYYCPPPTKPPTQTQTQIHQQQPQQRQPVAMATVISNHNNNHYVLNPTSTHAKAIRRISF